MDVSNARRRMAGGSGGGGDRWGALPRLERLSLSGCFNCDDPAHTIRDCPEAMNVVQAARDKLKFFTELRGGRPVATALLYALCQQLDGVMALELELGEANPFIVGTRESSPLAGYPVCMAASPLRGW